jgi:hypothetical protein
VAGYQNTNGNQDCATDIDECAPNGGAGGCQNSAACTDSNDGGVAANTYACACVAGYSSTTCATDVDECAPNGGTGNCLNGATCKDSTDTSTIAINTYACTCAAGYSGTNCPTDIDECAVNSGAGACVNSATCSTPTVNGYACACGAGYSGTNCATDIDECAANSGAGACENGATCSTPTVNAYACACVAGYSGTNCPTDIDECAVNNGAGACVNGATCSTPTVNGYACICGTGYSGTNCATDDTSGRRLASAPHDEDLSATSMPPLPPSSSPAPEPAATFTAAPVEQTSRPPTLRTKDQRAKKLKAQQKALGVGLEANNRRQLIDKYKGAYLKAGLCGSGPLAESCRSLYENAQLKRVTLISDISGDTEEQEDEEEIVDEEEETATNIGVMDAPTDAKGFEYREDIEGFVFFVPTDVDEGDIEKNITALRNFLWVDERTRTVEVLFMTYNGNYAVFDLISLQFEFQLAGRVMREIEITTIDLELFSLDSNADIGRVLCELFVLFCVIAFFLDELRDVWDIYQQEKETKDTKDHRAWNPAMWAKKIISVDFKGWQEVLVLYANDRWNLFDIISIVLFVFAYILWMFILIMSMRVEVPQYFNFPEDEEKLFTLQIDLMQAADYYSIFKFISVLNVFTSLARFFKYCDQQGQLSVINKTFTLTSQPMMHFCLMLASVMFTYGVAGWIVFGSKMEQFSSVALAFNAVYEIALGNFDMASMTEAAGMLGLIYFYLVTLMIPMVMTNVFLAIIMEG